MLIEACPENTAEQSQYYSITVNIMPRVLGGNSTSIQRNNVAKFVIHI